MAQQPISTKNTKNQILEAYEELLLKQQEKKTDEPKKIQELQKQETVVKNASGLSTEGIVKDVSGLKVNLSAALDKLSEGFIAEFRKFEELQKAIQIEKQQLEDLYQLSASTDSLSVMLLAQKEKKEQFELEMANRSRELEEQIKSEKAQFETEMAERKLNLKKLQEDTQSKQKEEAEQLQKNRKREEEEYVYTLKINRKKETDLYEEKKEKLEKELADKKAAFEKDFAEREMNIKQAESELNELRKINATFPAEMEKAVKAAVASATEKLETNYRFEKELREREVSGELKLKTQIIETLQSKIKDMEAALKDYAQKAMSAEASVKDIALRAIDSSSKVFYPEKNKEVQNKE
ncbi:MAG: hypothetical protein RBS23_03205 [Mariniphaga sp.]|jgi:hypothetical protein|nr:hypothetical protein [Mariniphaga sp.]